MSASGVSCQHNCLSVESAAAEMRAVIAQNPRVKDPIYHVMVSWREKENPSDDEAFACADHVLAAVGMTGHQHVYAIHRDTRNVHMHLVVNRVHPVSYRAVYPERDYYKLDRAMRELELRYGWQHDRGPYAVFIRHGVPVIDWTSTDKRTGGHIPSPAADMERHANQESFFSYVRGTPREAVRALLKASDVGWPDLHATLARFGIGLQEKGRGFAIVDIAAAATQSEHRLMVKASDVDEQLSRSRLEKRLGPFEVARNIVAFADSYDRQRTPKRDAGEREEARAARADARRDLYARFGEHRHGLAIERLDPDAVRRRFAALRAEAKGRRSEIRLNTPNRAQRKARLSIVAFETARAIERLRADIASERDAVARRNGLLVKSFRGWVEMMAARGDSAAIAQLRGWSYSAGRQGRSGAMEDDGRDRIYFEQARAPIFVKTDGAVAAATKDGVLKYRGSSGKLLLEDRGQQILFAASGASSQAMHLGVLLMGQLAPESYRLIGSDRFKTAFAGLIRQALPEESLRAGLVPDIKHTSRRPQGNRR